MSVCRTFFPRDRVDEQALNNNVKLSCAHQCPECWESLSACMCIRISIVLTANCLWRGTSRDRGPRRSGKRETIPNATLSAPTKTVPVKHVEVNRERETIANATLSAPTKAVPVKHVEVNRERETIPNATLSAPTKAVPVKHVEVNRESQSGLEPRP